MGRLSRSWGLFKTSFSVIKHDKELLWMPVLSFLASLIMIAGIAGIGIVAGIFPNFTNADGSVNAPAAALSFASYILLAFVQVYFHAATVAGANERLGGGDPTVGSSLRKANKHLGRLFLWAIVVATVNIILQAMRERSPALMRIVISIVGTAWNLATYFVVPILIFEDKGIGGGLKGSGAYVKKTWGETIAGEVGIGFIATIVVVATVIVGGLLTFGLASVAGLGGLIFGAVITILAAILASVIFSVASAVYKTALYRYASTGAAGGPFTSADLGNQWRPVA
jgi:hypothetical protein